MTGELKRTQRYRTKRRLKPEDIIKQNRRQRIMTQIYVSAIMIVIAISIAVINTDFTYKLRQSLKNAITSQLKKEDFNDIKALGADIIAEIRYKITGVEEESAPPENQTKNQPPPEKSLPES